MKNLTRVLALVLALSLVLGTVAFASFTDVQAGNDYAEAIETLAALGIVKGYEDGSFGGEKAITRAEAVAIVNRIQGLEKAAAGAASASLYTDVAADHWALGDINLATQMGIISGDGNGKFRPEDQVSYQEMVKMLTCAVNYQPAVEDLGGWPTGYLVAAESYGILENTDNLGAAAANREVVAQLTFNTLTAPLMVQEGFGTNKTYKVKDGEGATQTLLSEKLDIVKADAKVIATDVAYVTPAEATAEVGYAKIVIGGETADLYEVKKPNTLNLKETVLVADSTIDSKLGYQVVVYLQRNADREWEVLFNTVKEGTNVEYTFAAADIEAIKTVGSKTYISVVDDNDNETKYYVDGTTAVSVNGETSKLAATDIDTYNYTKGGARLDGNVTVLFADKNDDVASQVFVEKWYTDVVEEVAPSGKAIFLKYGAQIKLDTENNEELVYSLTMDGKDIAVTDLKEDDVVTYITANSNNYYKILVSRATVEGAVEAYYDDDEVYTIAGNDYEESQSALAVAGDINMKGASMAGTSGVFFLDAFGKIAGYSKTAESKGAVNYGYILAVKDNFDEKDEFSYEATAKVLTKDGIKDIDFADSVYVTVVKSVGGELDATKTKYNFAEADKADERTAFDGELAKVVGKDLIDYTVNSDGKITNIAYYAPTVIEGEGEEDDEIVYETAGENDYITKNDVIEKAEYSERNSMLAGKYAVDANTVVFYIGADSKDDYAVTDISFLVDDEVTKYDVTVYGMDDDRLAGAILITNEVESADLRGNLAVYVKYATINDEDEQPITQITYYQGGDLKTINAETKLTMTGYEAGDVVSFKTNTKGLLVEAPTVIADQANTAKFGYAYPALSKNAEYVYGQVIGKNGKVLKLGTSESAWTNHTVADDAKVYIVEKKANGKINVTVGSVAEITKNMYIGKNGTDGKGANAGALYNVEDADNYTVLLKYIEGDVIDVVAYKNFQEGLDEGK